MLVKPHTDVNFVLDGYFTHIYFDIFRDRSTDSNFLPVAIPFINSLSTRHEVFRYSCISNEKQILKLFIIYKIIIILGILWYRLIGPTRRVRYNASPLSIYLLSKSPPSSLYRYGSVLAAPRVLQMAKQWLPLEIKIHDRQKYVAKTKKNRVAKQFLTFKMITIIAKKWSSFQFAEVDGFWNLEAKKYSRRVFNKL